MAPERPIRLLNLFILFSASSSNLNSLTVYAISSTPFNIILYAEIGKFAGIFFTISKRQKLIDGMVTPLICRYLPLNKGGRYVLPGPLKSPLRNSSRTGPKRPDPSPTPRPNSIHHRPGGWQHDRRVLINSFWWGISSTGGSTLDRFNVSYVR